MFDFSNLLTFDNLNGPLSYAVDTGYGIFTNERNYNLQKSNYNYQKMLQQQIFAREDNAVQRRKADMVAAGFNPLLAAGNGASSGAVVSTSAPQRNNSPLLDVAKIATLDQMHANIDKTRAETAVAGATEKNLGEQNENLRLQGDLLKAQTIKAIADATGWDTREVALKFFGIGFSQTTKKPNKDLYHLNFSNDPNRNDMYHDYLRRYEITRNPPSSI